MRSTDDPASLSADERLAEFAAITLRIYRSRLSMTSRCSGPSRRRGRCHRIAIHYRPKQNAGCLAGEKNVNHRDWLRA